MVVSQCAMSCIYTPRPLSFLASEGVPNTAEFVVLGSGFGIQGLRVRHSLGFRIGGLGAPRSRFVLPEATGIKMIKREYE